MFCLEQMPCQFYSLARSRSEDESSGRLSVGPRVIDINKASSQDHRSVLDKIISLYQGRSVSFPDSQMHVPHRFFDVYEELELWTPFAFGGSHRYKGSPARAISTFKSLCSLSVLLVRLRHSDFRIHSI
jgi:hypothetical protein